MKKFICNVAQPGFCAGNTFVLSNNKTETSTTYNEDRELLKLQNAVSIFEKNLKEKKLDSHISEKPLFEMTETLLYENGYLNFAQTLIKEQKLSAIEAITKANDSICKEIQSSNNEYNIQRCDDYKGITKTLLNLINNYNSAIPSKQVILVAENLSFSELALIPHKYILGIITEKGYKTSHTSILAGMLGIPYLYGIPNLLDEIKSNEKIIIDSNEKTVTVNPNDNDFKTALVHQQEIANNKDNHKLHFKTKMKIYANVVSTEDMAKFENSVAEGIGLVRSELLFLNYQNPPTEEEQFQNYKGMVQSTKDKEIIIRTFDIGSDKKVTWVNLEAEKNPALGLRGIRVSLKYKVLLKTQLKALMRASAYGNLKILLPMITNEFEIQTVLDQINTIANEFDSKKITYKIPDVGIMIETPAAALIADQLALYAKFFSIGTNDLTQYTLAVDRESQQLDNCYNELHESIFKLIDLTVQAAHKHNIKVSICGELASNLEAIPRLCEIGIDELSVPINKLDIVKNFIYDYESNETNTENNYELCSPADGVVIPMNEIPNQRFANGSLGNCLGIESTDGKIYAPCDGVIENIAQTKHTIIIKDLNDQKFMIHVGLDTAKLNGEGFNLFVKQSDFVKQHQLLMIVNQEYIKNKGFNPIVIIVKL